VTGTVPSGAWGFESASVALVVQWRREAPAPEATTAALALFKNSRREIPLLFLDFFSDMTGLTLPQNTFAVIEGFPCLYLFTGETQGGGTPDDKLKN
jgi:hypothetical protein